MNPTTTPTIVGTRVTLREYGDADLELVRAVTSDPLIPLITTVPNHDDPAEMLAYVRRQRSRATNGEGYQFVVVDNSTQLSVGQIGVMLGAASEGRASLGYWIAPAHRRQGFVADALRTLTPWAFQLTGIARLELYVEPWNEGSWRAAEAVGFTREGLLRQWEKVGSERRDMYMYSLLR